MIDINDIKVGDRLIIKKATPSWVSTQSMNSYGWYVDTPYEVLHVNRRSGNIDLKKDVGNGFSYYHVSQLSYPFEYDVSEWSID